ncbi:MAG: bifunctional 5,10-methylenetetrahydrofolate dehydrogenase/5,10-methenyltetrahydrofolate cyclohydrolase [Bacteroidales bacterium]|jgi:methylenetetrahydrofolate dehydrogenase (NADP+)/methenyltetrahydrofolate cyclohydrolase|nr:bifunctional 5,10-methylenetetrahydrofolate dehydrogenase/5,10-methenyltetrahydrofolate cyclohydrolase [Bacteroidales bacterium]
MKIIDGKFYSEQILSELRAEVAGLIDNDLRAPHIAAVLVGSDGASETYIANKEKKARSIGMTSSLYRLPVDVSERELLDVISFLNNDSEVDGILVQLPLPAHISSTRVIEAISPLKDVDGFHPINMGRLALGQDGFVPATPLGVMELLQRASIDTEGKHCVILGRSNIVGTPMALLMSRNNKYANSTVTLCHSKTANLAAIASTADILIVAIGKPEFVTASMVREGAVVIDVGIHRLPSNGGDYRIVGDVKYNEVAARASAITPVPGGVGVMTTTCLLQNVMKAYRLQLAITENARINK